MKHSEILTFVREYLNIQGASVNEKGRSLLEVTYPDNGDSLSCPKKLLAFGRQAQKQHPEAELVTIGSACLDQIVSNATSPGRRFVCYKPVLEKKPPPRLDPASFTVVAGGQWGAPKFSYRPLFLFVYVAEYRTIDVPDDLELIPLDPVRGVMLASAGPLLEGLNTYSHDPVAGCRPLGSLPTPGTVRRSLEILDKRLLRRTRKVKEAATLEIARETANIEAYYRQLIDEIRHPIGRSRLSMEAEEERVHTLQLDWKRRVQEVALFWEAGANVRFSTLGVIMEPCWAVKLRGKGIPRGGRGRCPVSLIFDYTTGEQITPRCPICNAHINGRAELAGLDLICMNHAEEIHQANR